MDVEYVKKLIEVAECRMKMPEPEPITTHTDINGAVTYHATLIDRQQCAAIIAVKDYYETLLKAERSKVIADVRELLFESYRIQCPDDGAEWFVKKLDSMEPDKEDVE